MKLLIFNTNNFFEMLRIFRSCRTEHSNEINLLVPSNKSHALAHYPFYVLTSTYAGTQELAGYADLCLPWTFTLTSEKVIKYLKQRNFYSHFRKSNKVPKAKELLLSLQKSNKVPKAKELLLSLQKHFF